MMSRSHRRTLKAACASPSQRRTPNKWNASSKWPQGRTAKGCLAAAWEAATEAWGKVWEGLEEGNCAFSEERYRPFPFNAIKETPPPKGEFVAILQPQCTQGEMDDRDQH